MAKQKRRHSLRKRKRERDYQRSRVYNAQGVLLSKDGFFDTIEEAREYVNSILSKKWFRKAFSHVRLVRCVKSKSLHWNWAKREINTIGLSCIGMRPYIVLHELAHICTPEKHSPHGKQFCSVLLFLVKNEMGDGIYWELRENFDKYRVDYEVIDNRKNLLNSICANG